MAKKTGKAKLGPIAATSKAKQLALLKDFNKLLKEHAFSGTVAEFKIKTAGGGGVCPPGKVLREVCKKLPNGTVVCELKCVAE